jgi:hypothetical protein
VEPIDLAQPPVRRWTPRRVVVTPAALDHPHGLRILDRVESLGIEVERPAGPASTAATAR